MTALIGSDLLHWILAGLGVLVTLVLSYFGGKKVGTVQTQAKADVVVAQKESVQAKEVAQQRVQTTKAVSDVRQDNRSLTDAAVDNQLRDQWTKE